MKTFMRIGLGFVCCFSLLHSFSQHQKQTNTAAYSLPKPAGQYTIGTTILYDVDLSRVDSILNQPGRGITFQLWYPATAKRKPLRYITSDLYKAMDKENYNDINSLTLVQWQYLHTHASL